MDFLQQCGWLSVQQLGAYTSVVEVQKILINREPRYLYEKLTADRNNEGGHRTRLHFHAVNDGLEDRGLLQITRARLDITNTSWRWRAAGLYDRLPLILKQKSSIKKFKGEYRLWVKKHI